MSSSNLVSGGLAMYRARHNHFPRKIEKMKEEEAREKLIKMLGKDQVRKLQQKWKSLDTHRHNFDRDGDIGDGILICLKNFGLSCIHICDTIICGTSKLTKINQSQKAGHAPASHALSAMLVGTWCEFMDSLDIKDGLWFWNHPID